MKKTAWIVLIYASLVLIGGIIGYLRMGSYASLLSGGLFGILLYLTTFGMCKGKKIGYTGALILSIILEGFFTWRFAKTLQFFPAGFLGLFSLAVIIIVAYKISLMRAQREQ